MAQLGDTVITGSLAVSNCIYGSVTCATCATTSTNACKGWNGSAFANFGSNAFNSTAFTTCTGTVTKVCVGNTAYNPSSGVISLPAYPTCVACAGLVYLDSFTASADRPIMIACPRGTIGFSDQGISICCNLTFNPADGVLKITQCNGTTLAGCVCARCISVCDVYTNCVLNIESIWSKTPSCCNKTCCVLIQTTCCNSTEAISCCFIFKVCNISSANKGVLVGDCFCGTASSASTINRNGYTTAYDFDVALTNNSTTANGTTLYVSNSCRLKYCSTTGVLKGVAFCGKLYGCACCSQYLLNSAGNTAYKVWISV